MDIKGIYHADANRYSDAEALYKRCGKSGILLPKISLGFWHNFGEVDPYERSRAITHYAFDHGITHFDLANNYGPPYGSAEETMGRLMKDDFKPYRDELFISTKAGYDMWEGPYGNWGSRKYLKFADQYLKERDCPLLIFQDRLNMLDHAPQENGTLDYCAENGIGFISFSPLAQGLLTDRYLNGIPADSRMAKEHFLKHSALTPELLEQLKKWNAEAGERDETLAEMALAWILQQKGVTSVLVGASSTAQLEKNMKCVHAKTLNS